MKKTIKKFPEASESHWGIVWFRRGVRYPEYRKTSDYLSKKRKALIFGSILLLCGSFDLALPAIFDGQIFAFISFLSIPVVILGIIQFLMGIGIPPAN